MKSFINFISINIGNKNLIYSNDGQINLLDIGCSSFIPKHFIRYGKIINLLGCDPDLVGINKVKEKDYLNKFISTRFKNVAASSNNKTSFLEISSKRTGSQLRESQNKEENLISVDLLKTSNLQKDFEYGSANLIKIDAEGHELEIIKGIDLESNELLCIEVECTLSKNNKNLSSIMTMLENNNFFLATLRYHNQQTLNSYKFKNKFLRLLYKIFRKIPFINGFNSMWTDLSGKVLFEANKSFINQIELVFLKKNRFVSDKFKNKFNNILVIYGFLRYIPNLKVNKIMKFIIQNFPSR